MIWNRDMGIDDDGYTADCYDALCDAEKELLLQRQRDGWDLCEDVDLKDGLDDPDRFETHTPRPGTFAMREHRNVVSLARARERLRAHEAALSAHLGSSRYQLIDPKESA